MAAEPLVSIEFNVRMTSDRLIGLLWLRPVGAVQSQYYDSPTRGGHGASICIYLYIFTFTLREGVRKFKE